MEIKIILFLLCASVATGCAVPISEVSPEEKAQVEEQLQRLLTQAIIDMRSGTAAGYDHAESALVVAQELAPEDARVYDGFGSIECRRERYSDAKRYFQRAIQLDANYDRPYAHLAFVVEKEGDIPGALDLLQMAVRLNPLNFRARNTLAVMLKEQRSDGDAYLELLRAYHSGGESDPVVSYNMQQIGHH